MKDQNRSYTSNIMRVQSVAGLDTGKIGSQNKILSFHPNYRFLFVSMTMFDKFQSWACTDCTQAGCRLLTGKGILGLTSGRWDTLSKSLSIHKDNVFIKRQSKQPQFLLKATVSIHKTVSDTVKFTIRDIVGCKVF